MDERDQLSHEIRTHTMLHEDVKRFYDGFPKDAHPMATLSAVVSAMSTFYQDRAKTRTTPNRSELTIIRLIAKLPTIAAYSYKKSIGQPFLYPDNSLDFIENFLRMMFAVPTEPYEVCPTVVHALKQLLILHADHEQNCSTSTVRMVGSSDANLYASIAAGINALWGPLHGGANQAAIEMLEAIRDSGGDVATLRRPRQGPDTTTSASPASATACTRTTTRGRRSSRRRPSACSTDLGSKDALFDLALELEQVALTDEFFIERKLYPNVDFYSGLIYRAMGFPTNMFPVLFAMGRLPGWIAHWKEGHENPKTKIGRPRQIYTGPHERKYVPIEAALTRFGDHCRGAVAELGQALGDGSAGAHSDTQVAVADDRRPRDLGSVVGARQRLPVWIETPPGALPGEHVDERRDRLIRG